MKKALLMALVALFVADSAYATDYIGIYADAGHTRPFCGTVSTVYVFADMLDHNMSAVEFKLVFPPHVARSGDVVLGPDMIFSISPQGIEYDWSGVYAGCHMGWWEVCHLPITMTPGGPEEVILIAPGNDSDPHVIQISDCDGYICEPEVLINCCCATESASWGAIKSLF